MRQSRSLDEGAKDRMAETEWRMSLHLLSFSGRVILVKKLNIYQNISIYRLDQMESKRN